MNTEEIIQLWLDAEEENRKHTVEGTSKCMKLKNKFSKEFTALNEKDKQHVKDYLDSVGA